MRYVRLNCSMKAFCSDLPGWISRNSMPRSAHQVMKQSAISSGLLSSRIAWGCPRQATTCSNTRITRSAGSDVSISIAKPSRTPSSQILKVRNRRLPYRVSLMKSTAHTAFDCGSTVSGCGEPLLRPSGEIQPQTAIYLPGAFCIPRLPIKP